MIAHYHKQLLEYDWMKKRVNEPIQSKRLA